MRLKRLLAVAAAGTMATALGGIGAASAGDGLGKSGTDLAVDEIGYSKTVEHLSNTPPVGTFVGSTGSDIAFQGKYAFAGNYNGFVIYDITDPKAPTSVSQVSCPGSQNDITVSGNLLYLSTDSSRSDDSCQSTTGPLQSKESWEGIKIFDVTDKANPRYVKSVETACGSHTNSLVPAGDTDYIYVSSYGPRADYADCKPPHDLISIVEVPKANPTAASVVATPNLFPDGGNPGGTGPTGVGYSATAGCHDITAYPSRKIAAGACMGDGIIMDISDPKAPKVIERVRDTENFAFWHSATFNNKGTKVVFTDELGGGGAATCNEKIGPTRGANAIYELSKDNELTFASYYKIPRHQFDTENCVAHNGSIVPLPGRDVMVQSWYQGGTSVWDFTDSENPREIGYFERGPLNKERLVGGGTWSSYYYNGYVYSNDLVKGFDVLKLKDPSLKKAETVRLDQLNPQSQPVYPTR
ncbi:LVIVD repeat-containing protein [Oryzobacter telluris]|uniref:LVIVD repeat-containing protein n=1 Tax=Oryzobacter telluris TaxID=3149179 RepID=UPI00370D8C77